ncbi:MAG: DUF5610 domain-containing protein [Pseudomonadales bacterium]|nr:DUF5610 domain-containing protein [Pseudomonadales bacterium]
MDIHSKNVVPAAPLHRFPVDGSQRAVVKSPDVEQLNEGADKADVKSFDEKEVQDLLNERILATVSDILESDGAKPIDGLAAEDYSSEKVADRILSFVRSSMTLFALENPDSEHLLKKFDQALVGIERGFSEARDILDGLGALTGEVKEGVDETYALITAGMEKLYDELTQA